jgi:RNA polymerase primary sigma factor
MDATTDMTAGLGKRHSSKRSKQRLWYVSDRRIRTATAAKQARRIAQRINNGSDSDGEWDESQLFLAMHTCAYRACGHPKLEKIPPEERPEWHERWRCIREYIVSHNLGLAYSTMNRFQFKNVDSDDVLSEALFGLTRAVDRFNPFKGYRFSTYACNVIVRSLVRRLRQSKRYHQMFPVQHDVSMERPTGMPDSQTELMVERLHRAMSDDLGTLTNLESLILAKRFPADQQQPRTTFAAIGRSVGLSKERVRQIQNIALAKLRRQLDEDPVLQGA